MTAETLLQLIHVFLISITVVTSISYCAWRTYPFDRYSTMLPPFQCNDVNYPIMIIESAFKGYTTPAGGNCSQITINPTNCSQPITDFAQFCTGTNTSCQMNGMVLENLTNCGSITTGNYVLVDYSCIPANPPSSICKAESYFHTNTTLYISTRASFPISDFPLDPLQCSCTLKPLNPSFKGFIIRIRILVAALMEYTACTEQLDIFSLRNSYANSTYCSRSVSAGNVSYTELQYYPVISFKKPQMSSTNGDRILIEITTSTSSTFSGTVIANLSCDSSYYMPGPQSSLVPTHLTAPLTAFSTSAISTPASISLNLRNNQVDSLSTGAVVGIVVGSAMFVVLVIVFVAIFVVCSRKSKSKQTEAMRSQGMERIQSVSTPNDYVVINDGSTNIYSEVVDVAKSTDTELQNGAAPTESFYDSLTHINVRKSVHGDSGYDTPALVELPEDPGKAKLAKLNARSNAPEVETAMTSCDPMSNDGTYSEIQIAVDGPRGQNPFSDSDLMLADNDLYSLAPGATSVSV